MTTFAPSLKIEVDETSLSRLRFQLAGIKDGVPRAMVRALNDTSNKAKTEAIAEARLDVRLTATYLREQMHSAKDTPANKATFTRQTSRVTARESGIQLGRYVSNFDTVGFGRPSNPPRTKVKPSGASEQWPGGFLLPIGQDRTQIGLFTRDSTTGELVSHYGPSPSQIFQSEKDVIAPRMSQYLAERLVAETKAVLRQYG